MRAVVARNGRELAVEERPLPEPGPGQVRLRITACGICGSDDHLRSAGLYPPGRVPGHEFAGVVDRLGEGVGGWSEGDAVAVEPFHSCGACRDCRAGRDPLCAEARLLGLGADGGMADYAVAPARRLFRLPPELPAPVAALAEPTAVAVHGLRRGGLAAGQRVLVLGSGSVGLVTLLAARALGAGETWVTARHPHQAELARTLGASRVLCEAEADLAGLAAQAAETPFDLVVETVGGRADTLRLAGAAVRPAGSVSVLGFFTGPVQLDPLPLLMKEATLAWSYCYHHGEPGADFGDAVRILGDERELAARLVTHDVPLDQGPRAFDLAADRKAGAVKVSVRP